jgi:hypothetical protein
MEKNNGVNKKVQWYVSAVDTYTYDSFRIILDEEKMEETECADGKTRKLWKCDYDFICIILENKSYKNYNFTVHKKVGNSSIKECHLLRSHLRKKRLSTKINPLIRKAKKLKKTKSPST